MKIKENTKKKGRGSGIPEGVRTTQVAIGPLLGPILWHGEKRSKRQGKTWRKKTEETRENNGITVEKLSELGTPFLCISLINISNRFARSLFVYRRDDAKRKNRLLCPRLRSYWVSKKDMRTVIRG